MSFFTDLKQRFLKFDVIHGLYKIPLGIILIWCAGSNLPYLAAMLQIQYSIHDIAIFIGLKSLIEGLHDLFHNPVKKNAKMVMARNKYIQQKTGVTPEGK